METLIIWLFFAIVVGFIATDKAMGFWGGFLWSVLLSPLVGIIIVLLSKSKKQKIVEDYQFNKMIEEQRDKNK